MRFQGIKAWAVGLLAIVAGGVAYAAVPQRNRMQPPDEVDAMLADLAAAAESQPAQSPLRQAVEAGESEAAREMLEFRPYNEAPLPEGFPTYTPVGVIQVKQYPAYRKADGPAFWPLFQHIKSEGIPMTVPVEMTQMSRGNRPMSFLYQNTSVGDAGADEDIPGVTVNDAEPAIAVSLGIRGRMNPQTAADAKERLEAWLADQTEYRAAGEEAVRYFGYSSPMVPDRDKYWETQILIERVGE
ncbi:MAG: heme-binding protein [Planctomycetota bacterium]